MKKTLPAMAMLFSMLIILNSCSNTRQYNTQRKADLRNSREKQTAACFVQLNDGTLKTYNTIKLVTGIYTEPHLLADGKTKIFADEIMAYQNKDHFAISGKGFSYGAHKSNLAVETLPGFAVRIATGMLNVYVKKYLVEHRLVEEFFLQEANGSILPYSPELMDALIKNNPEAIVFFNSNRKHIHLTKDLKYTAYLFNKSELYTSK